MPHTLLDIAKLNGNDAVVGLLEENLTYAPELSIFPARTIKGTQYKTLIRTVLPTVGFRNANEGLSAGQSTFKNALVETLIFGGTVTADVAVANAYEDGADAYKAIESSGVAQSAVLALGKQIVYGTAADAKGFPGLQANVDSSLVTDALGTTANTGSSVYFLKFGPQGLTMVLGNGSGFSLDPWVEQHLPDASNKLYKAYVSSFASWVGLQTVNKYAIGRIKNLTADAGKGLTDSIIADALAKFPVGFTPDAILMNRRSRLQLQKSRSVTIFSGNGGKPSGSIENLAPIPTESFGIPITTTDSITSTEAIA